MNDVQAWRVLERLRKDSLRLSRALSPGLSPSETEELIGFVVGQVVAGVGEGIRRRIAYSVRLSFADGEPVAEVDSVVH